MTGEVLGAKCALRARREAECLVISLAGLFTLDSQTEVMSFARVELSGCDARAVIVDLTHAAHLLTDACWQKMADRAHGPGRIAQPVAIVVSALHEEVADRYCDQLAEHGILRAAFTDLKSALAWSSKCRVHWKHPPLPAPLAALRPSQWRATP